MRKLILASQSPRRRELLAEMGLSFAVESAAIEEHLELTLPLSQAVERLALQKAKPIWERHPQQVVIGADTVVAVDGRVLGKPRDEAQACEMLELLSGRTHQVIGGVAVLAKERQMTFHCITTVHFYPLTKAEIRTYVRTPEPFDKAGAYGIQGLGKRFVRGIEGDYFNVVGLPVSRLLRVLEGFGVACGE